MILYKLVTNYLILKTYVYICMYIVYKKTILNKLYRLYNYVLNPTVKYQ